MFCEKCGKEMSGNFCTDCGAEKPDYYVPEQSLKESGFGIAALVLCTVFIFLGIYGIPFFIVGAIFGIIAIAQKDRKSVCATIALSIMPVILIITLILSYFKIL